MDPYWLVALIVLAAVFAIGIFMVSFIGSTQNIFASFCINIATNRCTSESCFD